MNRYKLMGLMAGLMFLAGTVAAKEIHLDKGETYRQGDLSVTCGIPSAGGARPVALHECQYWDDFNQKCLFEKTTYTYNNLKCVEKCQHWDKFHGTCHFKTKCSFSRPQKAFVQTTCEKFDDYKNMCVKTRDRKIGP